MSTLSAKLKHRARVLGIGAALSAATLAILPGVAEAQSLGARAPADVQGGNAGPKITIQTKLHGNIAANTTQRGARGYVAQNTSRNFGGAVQGVSADSNLTSQVSGRGQIATTRSQNTGSIGLTTASRQATGAVQGVSTGLGDRVSGAATVDSSTVAAESIALSERPLVDGAVYSTTEAGVPAVPAQATATVNESVAAGDVVNQDVCLDAALNQEAGRCGGSDGDAGMTLDSNAGSTELAAPKVAVDSDTTVAEASSTTERPLLDGYVNSRTEVSAPSVTAVDANVTVGNLVNQDVCLNAGVNQDPGSCDQQPAPDDSGNGNTPYGDGNTPDDDGDAPNGGGTGTPGGDETPSGNETPDGSGETAGDFEDPTNTSVTDTPEGPDSSDFAASSPAERTSSAPELRVADSSTEGDSSLLGATLEDADLRLLPNEPGSPLASGASSDGPGVGVVFTSGEQLTDAEGGQQLGVGLLPDTGGVGLWKAALGLLLLLTGLLAARRSRTEVVART